MDRLDFERDGRDWPNRSASRFVIAGDIRWHVQVLGSGPPVLLLHGTGASTHSWRHIAPSLVPHFTLVLPDLPGHGFTGPPPMDSYTLPGMAKSVGALLKALAIAPVVAVGHSAGAAVALRMTLDGLIAPNAIVSVNGALRPFQGFAGQVFSPLAKLLFLNPVVPRLFAWRGADPSAVERLLEGTGSRVKPDDVEFYRRLFASPGHCAAALGMMARWDLDALTRDLPKLSTPLTLVVGTNDQAVPPADAEFTQRILPNARIETIAAVGHLAHEERPETVAEIILAVARRSGLI
ncbi:MAG: alpha/beta fold hydrolase BchO [Hyphomicrobium sp.]